MIIKIVSDRMIRILLQKRVEFDDTQKEIIRNILRMCVERS